MLTAPVGRTAASHNNFDFLRFFLAALGDRQGEIAAVLIRLLSEPALCRRLGAAGRQLQQERFTWEAVTDAHKKIFQEALSTAKSERQT